MQKELKLTNNRMSFPPFLLMSDVDQYGVFNRIFDCVDRHLQYVISYLLLPFDII